MSYWFVGCDPISNENLMRVIDSLGFDVEAPELGRSCTDGKKYNVIHIPNELVSALETAKRIDVDRILFRYKFFVADVFNGRLRHDDFIDKQYKVKKIREMQKRLERLELLRRGAGHYH